MPQMSDEIKNLRGPKKVLRINDSAFALPDDFDGSLQDAMTLFLEYNQEIQKNKKRELPVDPSGLFSPIGVITVAGNEVKCCVEAHIYELTDEGHYVDVTPDSDLG